MKHYNNYTFAAEGKACSEDVSYCFETPALCFYGLADGQSRKKYCREGGRFILRRLGEYVAAHGLRELVTMKRSELQCELFLLFRHALESLARELETETEELNSTLLALALDRETGEGVCVHIGDGILLGLKEEETEVLSSPENGRTLRYTYLSSSVSPEHIRIEKIDCSLYEKILLCTDGAWGIAVGRRVNSALCGTLAALERVCAGEILSGSSEDDAAMIEVRIMAKNIDKEDENRYD